MKNNLVYVKHIVEAIEKIESYIKNISFDEFVKNDLVFDAVVRELSIIGEAANRIDKKFRRDNKEIAWSAMVGIRNILVHEYFGVNKKVVWETCQNDLRKLKALIAPLI